MTSIEHEAQLAALRTADMQQKIADAAEEQLRLQARIADTLQAQSLIAYMAVLKQPTKPNANTAEISFLDDEVRRLLRL